MKKLTSIGVICCTAVMIFGGCGKAPASEAEVKAALSSDMVVSKTEEKHDFERNYGNTINNMYKKKQVAMYNGYMYYSDNETGLYKGSYMDESSIEKLNDDSPMFINVYKDNLYYICKSDNIEDQQLVKVDMD